MATKILTQERLKHLLTYDPETGDFYWAEGRGYNLVGKKAGNLHPTGYIRFKIDAENWKGHQLAWLYMTGTIPITIIDHINGQRGDNRWCNLRLADLCQNAWNAKRPSNNTSGAKGVSFHKGTGKWQVRIRARGKQKHIGLFDTVEEAQLAFAVAAEKFHGDFARLE